MTEQMIVTTYPVEHDNQVRWTGRLDGQVIITTEAGGRGVQIKIPPEAAADLAVKIAQTVQDILTEAGLGSPRQAVTVVGYDPDGRSRVYVDKALSAQTTVAEFRDQLRAAGVEPQVVEIITDQWRSCLADFDGPVGHA